MTDDGIFDAAEPGIIGSALFFAYAFGKLFNGVLADRVSVRAFMTTGLAVSALINLSLGFTATFWVFLIIVGTEWVVSVVWRSFQRCFIGKLVLGTRSAARFMASGAVATTSARRLPSLALPLLLAALDGRGDSTLPALPVCLWLRTPYPEMLFSLRDNPGRLRLFGMESPGSLYHQSLIARRQTDYVFDASTAVDFEPDNFQQFAGLTCYYNSRKFHYLYISTDDEIGKHIGIMSCDAD